MSEYYFNPDIQRHQIIEYNSPVLPIADRHKILIQLENTLIESLLGTRIHREQERVAGLYKCQFTLMGLSAVARLYFLRAGFFFGADFRSSSFAASSFFFCAGERFFPARLT